MVSLNIMKKKWMLFVISSLLSIPYAIADIGSTFGNVWYKIMNVGSLGFLGLGEGTVVAAFTRILLWILMFTVFFAVIIYMSAEGRPLKYFKKNHAMVIAAVLATIGAIFLPVEVILAAGAGWGTAIALLLIGGPIVGIAYLLWYLPGKDEHGNKIPETKWTVFLKIVICLLLLWILSVMKYHVGRMA